MAKPPRITHVKFVKAKGRTYAYFNTGEKVNGRAVYKRLPNLTDPGFWPSYAAYVAGRTKRTVARQYTLADLIGDFLTSPQYAMKARATQDIYRIQLAKVETLLGAFAVNDLEHSDIQMVLDGEAWGAATQNSFVAAISAVYKFGRRTGKARIKPAEDFSRLTTGEYMAWPENVLEAALRADDDMVRLVVHLLYFTGQRIGDVLKMRWSDVAGGSISITQQKTSKPVVVPMAAELRTELDRTPRAGITIMNLGTGKKAIERVRLKLQAFAQGHGAKIVTHGLRKNAVNSLLEAGCTAAQVSAITGQTIQFVEHYAKGRNVAKLGEAAIILMDEARSKRSA